jgi:ubiquinone/menaquinone biosynthesis C-methylase UbiE
LAQNFGSKRNIGRGRAGVTDLMKKLLGIHAMLCPFKTHEFSKIMQRLGPAPGRVLDVGGGSGLQATIMAKKAQFILSVDLPDTPRKHTADNIKFGNPQDIASYGESFNVATMICVIEHLNDPAAMLRDCYSALVPGGRILITADSLDGVSPSAMESHAKQHQVVNYFTSSSLREVLEESGFRVVALEPMFAGRFSRWLFRWCIRHGFKLPKLAYLPALAAMHLDRSDTGKGMFLFAEAVK